MICENKTKQLQLGDLRDREKHRASGHFLICENEYLKQRRRLTLTLLFSLIANYLSAFCTLSICLTLLPDEFNNFRTLYMLGGPMRLRQRCLKVKILVTENFWCPLLDGRKKQFADALIPHVLPFSHYYRFNQTHSRQKSSCLVHKALIISIKNPKLILSEKFIEGFQVLNLCYFLKWLPLM